MCDINARNQEIFEELNNFINGDKKILLLNSQSLRNSINLLHLLENEFIFSEIFQNTNNVSEFLFLLKQQYNPNKQKYELNTYFNHQVSEHFSFNFLLQAPRNLFVPDVMSYAQQIKKILKKLNNSKIAIILNMKENFCDEMIDMLQSLSQDSDLQTKFIIIYNSDKLNFSHKFFDLEQFITTIDITYSLDCLQKTFSRLSLDEINLLISLTNNDIFEMQNIYPYLVQSNNSMSNNKILLKDKIAKKISVICTAEEKYVLGLASYLVNRFSQEKINTILNIDERINKITDLASIINIALEDKFLDYQEQDYGFYTEFIKSIFNDLNKDNGNLFNNVIEKYLEKYHPFDYTTRRIHLKMSNDIRESEMIAMQLIHNLHFNVQINDSLRSDFIETFNQNLYNVLVDTFNCIEKGEYLKNYFELSKLDDCGSQVLSNEIEYLNLFLDWKLSDSKQQKQIETKLNCLLNSECELEQRIFVLLLKLSIVSNGKDNIFINERPLNIYNEINRILNNFKGVDFDYLSNLLKRKSNSAKYRATSITLVQQSFKYFSERKELYSKQYFMAGNNYIALLLQSISRKKQLMYTKGDDLCDYDDPIYIAETLLKELSTDSSYEVYAYLKNNYLVANELLNKKKINEQELLSLINISKKTNNSTQIMSYINVGTLYAIHGNLTKAKQLWMEAKFLNDTNDAFYNYILQNNLFIANIVSENEKITPFQCIDTSIFQDDIEINQFYNYRNKLLTELYDSNRHYTYAEICNYFENKFNEKNEFSLKLFSTPYLMSDIQFWSEN